MKIFEKLKAKKQKDTITEVQAEGLTEIMLETVHKLREYCDEEGILLLPALWSMGTIMRDCAEHFMEEGDA